MHNKRLIVIGGGTGGHIFPGLAVAKHMIREGWQINWLGSKNRIEADLVPNYGINIQCININGLRGKGIKVFIISIFRILKAWYQARKIIKYWKPNVVLGMGGYVSGPGCLAAWSCGIPVVIHEQNYVAGLTNKWLAKIACKVMQAHYGAIPNAEIVGNPVRSEILDIGPPIERFKGRNGPIRILVIGGSQGARLLNQIMPQVAAILGDQVILWHQVGKIGINEIKKTYITLNTNHKVSDFIDDISIAYHWSDVVVCRSGALTVSEIAAVGLAAIFVPFEHQDRQQYWNALPLEKAGAAKIYKESCFTVEAVSNILSCWNRTILLKMAEKARSLAVYDATERIAVELNKVSK